MPESQFQTTKSTATIPRMRQAAPFGARTLLLFSLLLLPVPLHAAMEASLAEAHTGVYVIRDRLIKRYRESESRANRAWTLRELGFREEDLRGEYFSADNYWISWPGERDDVVRIGVRGLFKDRVDPATFEIEVNLSTNGLRTLKDADPGPRDLAISSFIGLAALAWMFGIPIWMSARALGSKPRRLLRKDTLAVFIGCWWAFSAIAFEHLRWQPFLHTELVFMLTDLVGPGVIVALFGACFGPVNWRAELTIVLLVTLYCAITTSKVIRSSDWTFAEQNVLILAVVFAPIFAIRSLDLAARRFLNRRGVQP